MFIRTHCILVCVTWGNWYVASLYASNILLKWLVFLGNAWLQKSAFCFIITPIWVEARWVIVLLNEDGTIAYTSCPASCCTYRHSPQCNPHGCTPGFQEVIQHRLFLVRLCSHQISVLYLTLVSKRIDLSINEWRNELVEDHLVYTDSSLQSIDWSASVYLELADCFNR